MIKVENIEVFGWEAAIRGMRNPMNSWAKSDSIFLPFQFCDEERDMKLAEVCGGVAPIIKKNDLELMQKLYKAGTEHRKYLRMIHVQMDITAPLYWFKEWDTYKIATTSNSTSTMHKIHAKEFTLEDFSYEHIKSLTETDEDGIVWYYDNEIFFSAIIKRLNAMREEYLKSKNKDYWWQMIQLLPSSYNQRRTVDFSYETAVNMIMQRCNHKLDEWREFVEVLKGLPYVKEIMGVEENG